MASVRQKKKNLKKIIKIELIKKIDQLDKLNLEQELIQSQIDELNAKIAAAKKILKSKKATLGQLQDQLSKINTVSERGIEKARQEALKINTPEGGHDTQNNAEHYVAIKKYHDYIDKGIIKEQSALDKYQIADFMERIMSEEEYQDYVNESVKKADEIIEKARREAIEHPIGSEYDFSF